MVPDDHEVYEQIHSVKGHILRNKGLLDEALETFRHALKIADNKLGKKSRSSAAISMYIAEIYINQGKMKEAV